MADHVANKEQLIEIFNEISKKSSISYNLSDAELTLLKGSIDLNYLYKVDQSIVKYQNLIGDVIAPINRWLRFDPNNKQGLKIVANTTLKLLSGEYYTFEEDTLIDLSTQLTTAGADYFLYINDDLTFTASTSETLSTGKKIGRFHTLCVDAGTMTMLAPAGVSSGLAVGEYYLVKPYLKEIDPDFYNLYNQKITAKTTGTYYDVITCNHPLSGYSAKDILPESIFTDSFGPYTMFNDAMVYDKTTDCFVDVYLQSGTGLTTRSAYNKTHTVSRQPVNHENDMLLVGKLLPSASEFESFALGSNNLTVISGAADATTVGGHSDTASRRMISAIGCEECCGYLYQCLREFNDTNQDSTWASTDGQGKFGLEYAKVYQGHSGGAWNNTVARVGLRCLTWNSVRSNVSNIDGCRGLVKCIKK